MWLGVCALTAVVSLAGCHVSGPGSRDYYSSLDATSARSEANLSREALLARFRELYPLELWRSQGHFTDSFLDIVDTHWLQFEPPPKITHYILAGIYCVVMVAGICGNALVMFMFVRCKSLRTPANILVTNLAISDFLMMCEMPFFIYNSIFQGPAMGELGCTIYGFVGGLTGTVSISTLAAISMDRYYVVVYPLSRRSTGLRARLCVVIAWIYGAVFASLPLLDLGFGRYVPEGLLSSCSFDYLTNDSRVKNFIWVFFGAAWVLPFLLIAFCYTNIFRAVLETRNLGKSGAIGSVSSRHCKDHEKRRTEMKLAFVVLGIIGLWFAAWTPYAVLALLGILGQHRFITPFSSMVPAMFAKTASCLDPIVYAVTNQRFKQELKALFGRADPPASKNQCWASNSQPMSKMATGRRNQSIDSTEEDIEEVMVMVDLPAQLHSPRRGLVGRALVTPSERLPRPKTSSVRKASSWLFRPTFSNRTSSVRKMARSWAARSKSRSSRDAEPGAENGSV